MENLNELKPKDVMSALECCGYATGCTDCVLAKYDGSPCIVKKALALLREKDAEIERLNALNKVLKDNNHQCHRLGYEDAITEFLERAYAKARDLGDLKPYVTLEDLEEISKKLQEDLS